MRRAWIGAGVAAAAGVVGLVAGGQLLASRVRAAVAAELEEHDVQVGGLEVSLLSSFPLLEVKVADLRVGDLLALPEARVGLDVPSCLWGEAVEVRTVRLVSPTVRIETSTSEADEPAAETTPWRIQLDELDVSDATIVWSDPSAEAHAEVTGLDLRATGSVASDQTHLVTSTTIRGLTFSQGGVTWLRDTRWDADVEVDYDMATGAVALADNRIRVNDLQVALAGTVAPRGDDYALNLQLSTADTAFASVLSLVPGAYSDAFEGVDAGGTFTLGGTVKGTYGDELPGFDLTLKVDQGRFQYDGAPVGVSGIDVDAELHHPQGDADLTEIDVRRFAMAVGGTPITGALNVKRPVSDPDVDLVARGRLDLGKLASAIPEVAAAEPPAGALDLDVKLAGRASDYRASGSVKAKGLRYAPEGWPVVTIDWLDLGLTTARADLRALDLSWKGSALSARGSFDNVLPYALAGDTLTGSLELTSARGIDLRPFQGEDTEAAADEGAAVVIPVPANVDLQVDAQLARVRSAELDMEDVQGRMVVRDHTVALESLRARTLGGDVTMSGSYRAETDEHADVDFQIDALRFDLAKTVAELQTLKRLAPVLEGARGRLDTDMVLKARILRDGTPELSLLASSGSFGTTGLDLRSQALARLASLLHADQLKTLTPTGKLVYEIREGSLALRPLDVKLGTVPAKVSGSVGVVDRTLDLTISLKVPNTGADATVAITGTYDEPRVALKSNVVEQVVREAIDDLVAAARAQGDALVAAAEKQADRLRAEAKKAADKLRAEAKKAGDKLIAEAKGNPLKLAVAKEAAKAGEKEADKAADKLQAEADKAASKVASEAREQRDALIAEAEAKVR